VVHGRYYSSSEDLSPWLIYYVSCYGWCWVKWTKWENVGSPRSGSTFFLFILLFWKILLFLNLVHFPSTFNIYLCNIFATTFSNKSRTHPLQYICYFWIWTDSINRMGCSQFCITKPTSLFRKKYIIYSEWVWVWKNKTVFQVCVCAASHSICNGWRYARNILIFTVWFEYVI